MLFICKPTNPEPTSQPPPFSQTLDHYPPALITWGPGARQLGTAPTSQSPLKLFKPANPNPADPALPSPSYRNHNKGSCPQFSLAPSVLPLTLVLPHVVPHGVLCTLLLGTVRTNYLSNCNHLLICWPHQTWIIKTTFQNSFIWGWHSFREEGSRIILVIFQIKVWPRKRQCIKSETALGK